MALADRISNALKRIGTARTAVKRVLTVTGGDSFIGTAGTVTNNDTIINVQRNQYAGKEAAMLTTASRAVEPDDVLMTVPATEITLGEVLNPNLQVVLTDQLGNQEIYKIFDFDPSDYGGQYVAFDLYLRQVKRA